MARLLLKLKRYLKAAPSATECTLSHQHQALLPQAARCTVLDCCQPGRPNALSDSSANSRPWASNFSHPRLWNSGVSQLSLQYPTAVGKGVCLVDSVPKLTLHSTSHAASESRDSPLLKRPIRVFVVAGEPSGDAIGGSLMAALKEEVLERVVFAGVGGPKMAEQGLRSLVPMESIAVVGIAEVLPAFLRIWASIRKTKKEVLHFQPDVIVTIDSKGFCIRLLRKVRAAYKRLSTPPPLCIHYVPPSVWAWKGRGTEWLRKAWRPLVDHMLCILALEVPICKAAQIPATFVGNPVIDDAFKLSGHSLSQEGGSIQKLKEAALLFREQHNLPRRPEPSSNGPVHREPVVCLLPGSRNQEVQRLLPIFQEAVSVLSEHWPEVRVVIPTVGGPLGEEVAARVKHWEIPTTVVITSNDHEKYAAFAACDVALAASGTVSLQLLLAGVPAVVAYRTHWLTEIVAQQRAAVRHMSLPNILLEEEVVPEAIFARCTPARLAALLHEHLKDPTLRHRQAAAAKVLLPSLGAQKASIEGVSFRNEYDPKDGLTSDWLRAVERPSTLAASIVLKLLAARLAKLQQEEL